jgi:dCMP deaminase
VCDAPGFTQEKILPWSHEFWLGQAAHYATQSKDPSTKVGCVIVRANGTLVSAGVNGFPRGIADSSLRLEDRPTKYRLTIHAEMNALHFAHEDLTGATLYATFCPCEDCAKHVIQRGIAKIYYPADHDNLRWLDDQKNALDLFAEAKVDVSAIRMMRKAA